MLAGQCGCGPEGTRRGWAPAAGCKRPGQPRHRHGAANAAAAEDPLSWLLAAAFGKLVACRRPWPGTSGPILEKMARGCEQMPCLAVSPLLTLHGALCQLSFLMRRYVEHLGMRAAASGWRE